MVWIENEESEQLIKNSIPLFLSQLTFQKSGDFDIKPISSDSKILFTES